MAGMVQGGVGVGWKEIDGEVDGGIGGMERGGGMLGWREDAVG